MVPTIRTANRIFERILCFSYICRIIIIIGRAREYLERESVINQNFITKPSFLKLFIIQAFSSKVLTSLHKETRSYRA